MDHLTAAIDIILRIVGDRAELKGLISDLRTVQSLAGGGRGAAGARGGYAAGMTAQTSATRGATTATREYTRAVQDSNRAQAQHLGRLRDTQQLFSHLSTTLQRVAFLSGAVLGALGGATLAVGAKAISARAEWQSFELTIGAITHSAGEASLAMRELAKNAVVNPFSLKELVTAFQSLRQYIPDTNKLLGNTGDELGTISKLAFVKNRPLDTVVNALMALRGGVTRRAQLNPLGINTDLYAKLGIPVDDKGRPTIDFKVVFQKVLDHFRDDLAGIDLSKNLKVVLTNFGDLGFQFMAALGKGMESGFRGIGDSVVDKLQRLTKLVNGKGLQDAIGKLWKDLIDPAAEKALAILDRIISALEHDPEALTRAVEKFVGFMKTLVEIFVTSAIGAFVTRFIATLADLAQLFEQGPWGAAVALILSLGAAFLGTKAALDSLTGSHRAANPELTTTWELLREIGTQLKQVWDNLVGVGSAILEAFTGTNIDAIGTLNAALKLMVDLLDKAGIHPQAPPLIKGGINPKTGRYDPNYVYPSMQGGNIAPGGGAASAHGSTPFIQGLNLPAPGGSPSAVMPAGTWTPGQGLPLPGTSSASRGGGGGNIQLPTSFKSTHATGGLPGFPAVDIMATPGTSLSAPEDGTLLYAHFIPWDIGERIGGWTCYFQGHESGNTYFITHMATCGAPGEYGKGQEIGTVSSVPGNAWPSHAHVGLHQGLFTPAGQGSPSGSGSGRGAGSARGGSSTPPSFESFRKSWNANLAGKSVPEAFSSWLKTLKMSPAQAAQFQKDWKGTGDPYIDTMIGYGTENLPEYVTGGKPPTMAGSYEAFRKWWNANLAGKDAPTMVGGAIQGAVQSVASAAGIPANMPAPTAATPLLPAEAVMKAMHAATLGTDPDDVSRELVRLLDQANNLGIKMDQFANDPVFQEAQHDKLMPAITDYVTALNDAAAQTEAGAKAESAELLQARQKAADAYTSMAETLLESKGNMRGSAWLQSAALKQGAYTDLQALAGTDDPAAIANTTAALYGDIEKLSKFAEPLREKAPEIAADAQKYILLIFQIIAAKAANTAFNASGQAGPPPPVNLGGAAPPSYSAGQPGGDLSGGPTPDFVTDGITDYEYCPLCDSHQGAIVGPHDPSRFTGGGTPTSGAFNSPKSGGGAQKAPADNAAKGLQAMAGFLNDVNSALKVFKDKTADTAQKIGALGPLLDKVAPGWGTLLSAGASLFDTLFGKKKIAIDGANSTPLPTFPAFNDLPFAANPAALLFAGQGRMTGAALNLNVALVGDAKQVLTAWVGDALGYQNQLTGRVGVPA